MRVGGLVMAGMMTMFVACTSSSTGSSGSSGASSSSGAGGSSGSSGDGQAPAGGDGGDGGTTDTATATETINTTSVCVLGWTKSLKAVAFGSDITVAGRCGDDGFDLRYSPTPAPGGSAPLVQFSTYAQAAGRIDCGATEATGTIMVTGAAPNLRVNGTAQCTVDAMHATPGTAKVTFDLPLDVQ